MTDPADLAHDVLLKVAAFVKSLPADQLADLASGAATLTLVPRAGRAAAPSRATASKPLSRPVAEIETMLAEIGTRAAAVQYLHDERLTVPQLRELAKVLGVALPSKSTKDAVITKIVDSVVGRRLDSAAISRLASR